MAMLEWTVEEEVHLFTALSGLRPIGVNKHFYMACITERLSKSLKRDIDPETIWEHLRTMYNLDALDQAEPLPFSNEEREFFLPESEFGAHLSKKRAESENKNAGEDTAANNNNGNSASTSSTDNAKNAAVITPQPKDKKDASKSVEAPKRAQKRTRGSTSLESNSPSTTPPPTTANKRRRI